MRSYGTLDLFLPAPLASLSFVNAAVPFILPSGLNFGPDGSHTLDKKKIYLLALILMLTIYWLLSFFGQSIVGGVSHTSDSPTCYPSLLLP
jgi:hypothetical protein